MAEDQPQPASQKSHHEEIRKFKALKRKEDVQRDLEEHMERTTFFKPEFIKTKVPTDAGELVLWIDKTNTEATRQIPDLPKEKDMARGCLFRLADAWRNYLLAEQRGNDAQALVSLRLMGINGANEVY